MLRLICKQIPKEETSPTLTRPFPLSSVCRWLLCSLCEHSPLEELTHKIIYFILLYITYWEHSVLQENSFLVCIFRGKVLLFWPVSVSFRLSAVFFFVTLSVCSNLVVHLNLCCVFCTASVL